MVIRDQHESIANERVATYRRVRQTDSFALPREDGDVLPSRIVPIRDR